MLKVNSAIMWPSPRDLNHALTMSLVSAVGLVVMLCAQAEAQDRVRERTFSVSMEPNAVVLRYMVTGSLRPEALSYTLFGDGRLLFERFNPTTGTVSVSSVTTLEHVAAIDLVGSVVDSGLLECSESCIADKVKRSLKIKKMPRAQDGDEVTLTLNLIAYKGPDNRSESGPLTWSLFVHSPGMLAFYCPEVEELQGLVRLGEALHPYSGVVSEMEE